MNHHKKLSNKILTYTNVGVNIKLGNKLINSIKPFAKHTMRNGVLSEIGNFAGLFELIKHYDNPVLVSSADGVGTKIKLALELNRHNSIGHDLVAMNVNDILTQGAEPLFFLDYFACSSLNFRIVLSVINGIALACKLAGCALLGGETAEMPNMYANKEYDLAGFVVGVVEKNCIINGKYIQPNDVILGLASDGIHSNGYSIIRKIIERKQLNLESAYDNKHSFADILMLPTRIYVKSITTLLNHIFVKGIAHITGGGLINNVPRILGKHLTAEFNYYDWSLPPLFKWIQKEGNLSNKEMYKVFNCGIGMVIIISANNVKQTIDILSKAGEKTYILGKIRLRKNGESQIIILD